MAPLPSLAMMPAAEASITAGKNWSEPVMAPGLDEGDAAAFG